jgi:predicted O-linked N-acetylglucosamine transferase (SPINDLY family)
MPLLFPFDGRERRQAAQRVAARLETDHVPLPPAPPRQQSRIRVAVLSPDFREHLNSYLLLPLFELLDRKEFEIRAYSLSADDGSAIRARVRQAADSFVDLQALSDAGAASRIRADDVDILLDVAGHTTGGRFAITARRPARVQASYLGFLGSLGSTRLDYALTDRVIAPDASEWSETLVHLPNTFFLYDFRTPPPQAHVSRRAYGLPDDAVVYCAFHQAPKITPDGFAMWMAVLQRVPRSVLWFRALSDATRANLLKQAAIHGVDPSRLVFAPYEPRTDGRYFARHALGDLLLDAPHHNAITSACDALASGLPVLTLCGSAPASRAGESIARAAGLEDLVASSPEAFVELAVKLGTERKLLVHYRSRLPALRATAPLFDTPGRVRDLADAFRRMMQAVP